MGLCDAQTMIMMKQRRATLKHIVSDHKNTQRLKQ